MEDRTIRYNFTCDKKKNIDTTLNFLEKYYNSDGYSILDNSITLVD